MRRIYLFIAFIFISQSVNQPLLAQTNTPQPATLPLTFNQTVSGQLRAKGDSLTYRVEVPKDQDVVIAYTTTKSISSISCFYIDGEAAGTENCVPQGGGGGDGPLSLIDYVATHEKAGQEATFTLIRPLDGSLSFEITAYAVTPQNIQLSRRITGEHSAQNRFQVYSLEADPLLPFSVTVEDEAEDGNYLWAANQPFSLKNPKITENRLIKPEQVDSAGVGNHPTFTSRLYVYYGGENTYRILVEADKDYRLNINTAILPVLEEKRTINMSVSYRQPLWVVRLAAKTGSTVKVDFNITSGAGAIARVYVGGNPFNQGMALGVNRGSNSPFPLNNSLEVLTDTDIYVMVQIPFDFTRETVNVSVTWHQVN